MYLVSTGMVCSVGLNAASACAAMRAGIDMFQELPYIDNSGEPIIGAMVPGLEPNLKREERLIEMLSLALQDCLGEDHPESMENIPLLVALSEPDRPGGSADLADRIISLIEQRLNVRFHPQLSRAILTGHTAGFEALAIARKLVRDQDISSCIVCGVDSLIRARTLLWLDNHARLKTEENSDGVIPGEAAAALLVTSKPNENTNLQIVGLGFGYETAGVLSEDPLFGLGLSQSLKIALNEAGIGLHEIDFRLSDVTGESYGFREQMLTLARVMRMRREEMPIWHPAEFIGDTGAAAGVCQLVLAVNAYKKGCTPGDRSACYTSAVSGARAVALLRAIEKASS